ncbi:NmrA/HSCARG family protein [Flammeovirga pectinis]|uniref:NmrA/HSCARG family protein n=1 Tax=Flammeovirga pectinis TaxID=2494373 RepID=A0A3Q9FTC6_9BACT|nr:NmrA/HSCARG family protein [Flammeovirga pectinis]AZQ64152.1 NmrA/HSCARG family protein [Flammeovirga pectinis]
MEKKIIVVIGATGAQGSGVVKALKESTDFVVRAVTRNPEKYDGLADEAVAADLTDASTLPKALENAYGVFGVTNFWEPNKVSEVEQGQNLINAAKEAGVKHFVWSTLPNVEEISDDTFDVPHFTGKAKLNAIVAEAGFETYTLVEPPFYYQNFVGMLAPQQLEDGTTGWALPIDPAAKVIHMGDISELGNLVASAFIKPEEANGKLLSFVGGIYSFNEVIDIYKSQGIEYSFQYVPADIFSGLFEGAAEIAQMLLYFEAHTYMGPDAVAHSNAADKITIKPFTSLDKWVKAQTIEA